VITLHYELIEEQKMSLSKFTKSLTGLPPAVRENPFVSKARKTENPDENADKTEYIKLEFYMDPSNPASKYARHFIIFKDGCAEDWVKWLMAYREIETLMILKEPADKSKMVRTLLKGQALSYFEHHLKRRLDCNVCRYWSP
jgi:hypothetical protein